MDETADVVLELLEETQLALSREGIYYNLSQRTDADREPVERTVEELAEYGLLEEVADGLYQASDFGRAYLHGEIDEDDLQPT